MTSWADPAAGQLGDGRRPSSSAWPPSAAATSPAHRAWMTRAYALGARRRHPGVHGGLRRSRLRCRRRPHRPDDGSGLGHQPRRRRVGHPPSHRSKHQACPDGVGRCVMTSRPPDGAASYELRVGGHLDQHWSTWFDGLTCTHEADGTTTFRGVVTDQSELHGLLAKVRDSASPRLGEGRRGQTTPLMGAWNSNIPRTRDLAGRQRSTGHRGARPRTDRPSRLEQPWLESINRWLTSGASDLDDYRTHVRGT